jgi:hypothetical protein
MWVPRKDAMAVQNALLKNDELGYELALDKSKQKQKFPRNLRAVAFFIDNSGYIESMEIPNAEYYDCLDEYESYTEDEINYEVTLSN